MVLTPAPPHTDRQPDPTPSFADVELVLRDTCARIAPLWPLERFVAVNPYLGLTDHSFADASARLAIAGGVRTTMPVEWYLARVDEGRITHDDIVAAHPEVDPVALLARARHEPAPAIASIPTVAQLATQLTGDDWTRFVVDRVSQWAAAHFDAGQAIWRAARPAGGTFAAWRFEASLDRTPEIMGLTGFRAAVRALPADPVVAAAHALRVLGLDPATAEPALHAALLPLAGWAAHAARLGWEAAQRGDTDDTQLDLLAVVLCWEALLLQSPALPGLADAWAAARPTDVTTTTRAAHAALDPVLVLQDAFDHAAQRELVDACATGTPTIAADNTPDVQAVFCIDVRSEVLRRHLEHAAPSVATLGFAGFFGFPVAVRHLGHEHDEPQCPVLLTPAASVDEVAGGATATATAADDRRLAHHVRRAWKSFKMGAISCFSFVGPVGLAYLPKLVTDGTGRTRPVAHPDTEGLHRATAAQLRPSVAALATDDKVRMAAGALRGMSLTRGLAPLVVLVGHGASTVNNPYATGLDCGACGGHSGALNARVAAMVLNEPEVRAALALQGIDIPATTWFGAALHDTTTDDLTVFDDDVPATHRDAVATFAAHAADAGRAARWERAPRLGITTDTHTSDDVDELVRSRSRDWAQVRPEWGLAGCRAFVAAPRDLTRHLDLGGRAFLHSYDHTLDTDHSVLELIMTAPMVVASWISLQYQASTVDNAHHGSGDKTLHNVIGRLGVLEGNGGDLRTGLPLQSVHDGEHAAHEPLRLAVVIAAPRDAIDGVLAHHADVRALIEHEWVHLLTMSDNGRITHRRTAQGWVAAPASTAPAGQGA